MEGWKEAGGGNTREGLDLAVIYRNVQVYPPANSFKDLISGDFNAYTCLIIIMLRYA